MKDTSPPRVAADETAIGLAQQIHEKLSDLEGFTGARYSQARTDILTRTLDVVSVLAQRVDSPVSEQFAYIICRALFGTDGCIPGEFWATPTGADIAYAVGYPRPRVDTVTSAEVLLVTRQHTWGLVREGKMELTPEGLRAYLRGPGYDQWQERHMRAQLAAV